MIYMTPRDRFAVFLGKIILKISVLFGVGAGGTWPGEIALMLSPGILQLLVKQFRHGIILVAGTNGKTTTSLMLKTVLTYEGYRVVINNSGANLVNGLVSACISKSSFTGNLSPDWGVFEVDENSLPLVLRYVSPKIILLLNIFRDQLDRYGEVDVIAEKWMTALKTLKKDTTLVCNADDPLIASIGKKSGHQTVFFGLAKNAPAGSTIDHATDSLFCMNCGSRLGYTTYYFSHLGHWFCPTCGEKRPSPMLDTWESPLPGLYNRYNTLAAALAAMQIGIHASHIKNALKGFAPAFGRQEECVIRGKTVKLLLSKNPTGFNASLRAVLEMKPKVILLSLNDRIPDGRDVSWIWDVDFEMIPDTVRIIVTGERVYDLAIRIQYAGQKNKDIGKTRLVVEPDVKQALQTGLNMLKDKETLFVLPTYSAMLDIRKILTGKKIL
jgi:lipid II isoglutaminyl synthase (glutamine-hydrolysing)